MKTMLEQREAELSKSTARIDELEQTIAEFSDMIDGEHAINERLIREGQEKTDRIAALRAALADIGNAPEGVAFAPGLQKLARKALAADSAAADDAGSK